MTQSQLEAMLDWQMQAMLSAYPDTRPYRIHREFMFARPRRWRADFAFPELRIFIEVEGGIWVRGRHTRGAGFIKDCEKYNAAALNGFIVLRFTREHIVSGYAIRTVEKAILSRRRYIDDE